MNVLKLALLGTAAVAAVSVSARADDLSDLKAQIEALNSRIASLESTPSVPAGYQMLAVGQAPAIVNVGFEDRKGLYKKTATNIAIMPTADVPASTNIQWSGFVRTALDYRDTDFETGNLDGNVDRDGVEIRSRAEIKVVGTTDTAVGEVGVQVKLRSNFEGDSQDGTFMPDGTYGWWKMTPELMLSAGYNGSLSNIGYGYDGACTCYYTDNAPVALNPGDRTQMRLSYASGPISFAVAIEDGDLDQAFATYVDDNLGAAAEIKYSGDAFSAELSAGYWDGRSSASDKYQVGVGMDFSLGDSAKISMAAGIGQGYADDEYVKATILASVNLSDAVHAEVAFGYADFDDTFGLNSPGAASHDVEVMSVLGGIYYDPVSQLTIGLEAEYQTWDSNAANSDVEAFSADLVTVFRF